ncbi:MAG: hypothetical protein R3191_01390 [Anaerolineales bacterium]|nr:hypothetical protein [Anaerolineales bacterium]
MIGDIELRSLLLVAAGLIALGLLAAGVLAAWVLTRVRRIRVSPEADFLTALRQTPLSVVILLDLLDFSLDIFAAPFAWALLGRLGLRPLRGVTVVEAVIPGTQLLPTMTLAWLAARALGERRFRALDDWF